MAKKKTPGKGERRPLLSLVKPQDAESVTRALDAAYAEKLEKARAKVESGDGEALLGALLDFCLTPDRPMPPWLALELAGAAWRYIRHDAKSLDDAFRVSRPKNYRHEAMKLKVKNITAFCHDVISLSAFGVAIDKPLFTEVGKLYGIGGTKASEWWRDGALRRMGITGKDLVGHVDLRDELRPIYLYLTGKQPPERAKSGKTPRKRNYIKPA